MARRAVSGGVDVQLLLQELSESLLILGLPSHVRNPIERTQMLFRIAVAVETPAHAQRLGLIHLIHLVNAAVAGDATNAAVDVYAVIEVGVVRQVVNFFPFDRLASRLTLPHAEQFPTPRVNSGSCYRAIRVGCTVTIHASRRWRNGSMGGSIDRVVTVPTIHIQCSSMQLVTERHGLLRRVPDIHGPRGRAVRANSDNVCGSNR